MIIKNGEPCPVCGKKITQFDYCEIPEEMEETNTIDIDDEDLVSSKMQAVLDKTR